MYWFTLAEILRVLKNIHQDFVKINTGENKIMAALEDLKASVARLAASTSAELKAIADKLAGFGDAVTAADVEATVADINKVSDSLDAEVAALNPPVVVPPVEPPPAA